AVNLIEPQVTLSKESHGLGAHSLLNAQERPKVDREAPHALLPELLKERPMKSEHWRIRRRQAIEGIVSHPTVSSKPRFQFQERMTEFRIVRHNYYQIRATLDSSRVAPSRRCRNG